MRGSSTLCPAHNPHLDSVGPGIWFPTPVRMKITPRGPVDFLSTLLCVFTGRITIVLHHQSLTFDSGQLWEKT